ncbi:hypothetical protein REPUB_Repub16aG0041000 [Reevesia pubescens]
MERDAVEYDLTFAGFASRLSTILSELKNSSHDLVMITGDQALTACHVTGQVHIVSKPALILVPVKNSEGYEWVSPDETERICHRLCFCGLINGFYPIFSEKEVFARVASEQKELIMTTFKTVGRMTLMCGDGTNDVGTLKQAHAGVALLNAVPPTKSESSSSGTSKDESTKSLKSKKSKPSVEAAGKAVNLSAKASSKGKVATILDSSNQTSNRHLNAEEMHRQKLKKLMDEMKEKGDGCSAPIVKLGDASMASHLQQNMHQLPQPLT